jgi:thioredoxin 2
MIRTCENCGAKNRIPAKHLADKGRCGSCKAELPPVGQPIEADPILFDEVVSAARVPVLVDFWASWCGPCLKAAPEVSALAKEMAGRAIVLKVDTEAHPGLASRYHVQGIPNFIVFRDGQVAFQQAGAAPRAQMRRWLE